MLKQSLHTNWTVRAVSNFDEVPAAIRDREIPAQVPGCIHTDLLRAKLIDDPYIDRNEATVQWIGRTDWRYRTTFDVSEEMLAHERVDLACDGLDTVARIEINGQRLGETANMFHGHRFDAKRLLKPGENELTITLASAVHYAQAQEARLGTLPWLNGAGGPFNFIRKMACNFGWDWGPALVTCGIWKEIRLEGWNQARFSSPRVAVVSATVDEALIELHDRIDGLDLPEDASVLEIIVSITLPGGRVDQHRITTSSALDAELQTGLRLKSPELWWPSGYGDQPLYGLQLELMSATGQTLDGWSGRIGLRTVELDRSPDEIGRKFVLKVNGKPIFCKGFNWIPDDCFLDRACTPERYRTRIQQALDTNANMLRVWGGGIYETDAFYDVCDELGILVWQDFPFACAAYPEEEPFWSSVEREARDNVGRLSHHPSLAIWNGCNENLIGYHDWGWREKAAGRTWGPGYYFDLLPRVVAELDPSRPYWAASPWSGDPDVENGLHANLASHGNKHVWEAWFGESYTAYRRFTPRFCSEFGFQGPPTYATLARAVPPEQRFMGSASMKAHQKSPAGDRANERHLADSFQAPENFHDHLYLLQVNQARALTTGVEWFRSRAPVCMGTLYWQLNDCWPVTSWSAIDGDGRKKPLWYATRRFYAPRLLTIQPTQDMYELCIINDSDEPWQDAATIGLHDMPTGETRTVTTIPFDIAPRSVGWFSLGHAPLLRPRDASSQFMLAQAGPHRTMWFYRPDKELNYPAPQFDASLETGGDIQRLTITARTILRDLCLFPDRLDPAATIDDQLVTLLADESRTFDIVSKEDMTKTELTAPPVLQCVNRFGRV